LVVLLVLVLVLAGLCSGPGGENAADSPAEQAEQNRGAEEQQEAAPEPEPEPEPPTAAIGETVEVGSVAWQVTGATQATQLTSDFMEPKQGNFVIVDFLFTNNGDEATTLDPISLSLLDGEGRTSDPDTDTFGYIPPDKDVFLNQVNPGVTDDGQVIFTVAPGAADFTLEVGDAALFSDESARVDLGF
jgi:hypothetical protein